MQFSYCNENAWRPGVDLAGLSLGLICSRFTILVLGLGLVVLSRLWRLLLYRISILLLWLQREHLVVEGKLLKHAV